jgi:MoxR-like ATPase
MSDIMEKIERLREFSIELKNYYINKNEEIDMMLISAVSGEPLLFVGEPGTAKSDMIVKFTKLLPYNLDDNIGLYYKEGAYFEYMLTRFTEPSEIIGPLDILKLKEEGVFERNVEGKLPEAEVVFLDEIFKANSAILNVLLTIINEKKYYQGGKPKPVKLKMLFAATNKVSVEDELKALKDRFTLKVKTRQVQDNHFDELVVQGLKNEYKEIKPVNYFCFEDLLWIRNYISKSFEKPEKDIKLFFDKSLIRLLIKIISIIKNDLQIFISDRKIIKIYKLLRVYSTFIGDGTINTNSLKILKYIGEEDEDFDRLEKNIEDIIIRANIK